MIGNQIGSYRLLKLLGEGGMGRVFLAEHVVMGDLWALKQLANELADKPEIVARFVDEARAAARVRHNNLVRVFHVDRTSEGLSYMILEYLEGDSLSRFIGSHGPGEMDLVVRLASQIASALREIHKHGIVHRDIKPDNVLLISRGGDDKFPVVLDLGVAHLGNGLATGPGTQAGLVIGTPSYMAPEQLLGDAVGPTADLFSLGVLVYELATGGHLPWQHDDETRSNYFQLSPTALYRRQERETPVDPRRHVASMTDAFAAALLAPLAFDPARRPKDERPYILGLAQSVPGDDGLQIVREYAVDLLASEHLLETIRTAAPAILATPGSETKYVLGEKLGAGGMAEVFAAQSVGAAGFERPVAIKRVLRELSAQETFAAMFIAEARMASRLSHPNIVAVSDFQRDADGAFFLVMELVDGKDLAALLEAGPLPPSVIIYVMVEMLRGLGYAHSRLDPVSQAQGIIHRDVSPHNVLISREGEVKIGDFGLSRAGDAAGRALSGTVRGKPAYMAPEQARALPLDRRTDLFAAGVVLWEMLARLPLFTGNASETMASVIFKDILLPSVVAPERNVPPDLEAVAMRLLQRNPDDRYQTAEAVIAALLHCRDANLASRDELIRILRGRFPRSGDQPRRTAAVPTVSAHRFALEQVTATALPSTLGRTASQSTPILPPSPPRSRRTIAVALTGAIVSALIAFAVVLTVTRHRDPAPARLDAAVVASAPPSRPDASPPIDAGTTSSALLPDAPSAPIDAQPAEAAPTPMDASPGDAGSPSPSRPPLTARPDRVTTTPPPPTNGCSSATVASGELAIIVKPWAKVWINGKSFGDTPFREPMPPGRYRIRLKYVDGGKDESFTVTVEPKKTTLVERTWL